MESTVFWLIRHAIVAEASRAMLYGRMDVDICIDSVERQSPTYRTLAARLPATKTWIVTPLSRTQRTAGAIQRAGYPETPLTIEPGLTEQDLGSWQGLRHADLPAKLVDPAHPFWPVGADEVPPGGESMAQVVTRVGAAIERLAEVHRGGNIVCVSHGGAIRAAVAHALGVDGRAALHLSIHNLGLTILERFSTGWRVVTVNEGTNFPP